MILVYVRLLLCICDSVRILFGYLGVCYSWFECTGFVRFLREGVHIFKRRGECVFFCRSL
jgi:hypothetical protein